MIKFQSFVHGRIISLYFILLFLFYFIYKHDSESYPRAVLYEEDKKGNFTLTIRRHGQN